MQALNFSINRFTVTFSFSYLPATSSHFISVVCLVTNACLFNGNGIFVGSGMGSPIPTYHLVTGLVLLSPIKRWPVQLIA